MFFNSTKMNARASPGGDAVHTRPSGLTHVRGLLRQDRWSRLKKHVGRLRVVSWNVDTMTGKAMEIADVLRRRKVDIAYFNLHNGCSIGQNINSDLSRISEWLHVNKLCINANKSKFMLFHSPNKK